MTARNLNYLIVCPALRTPFVALAQLVIAWMFLYVVLVSPAPAGAQEIQDVGSVRQMAIGLTAPESLSRAKRKAARKGAWPLTMMAAGTVGGNSNIFLSPTREEGSLVSQGAIKAEVLHYFDKSTRLSMSTQASAALHTESTRADSYELEGSAFFAHRFDSTKKFLMSAKFSRENDDVTRIDGSLLRRNFAANVYRASPALLLRPNKAHRFRLGYRFKVKDFDETPGLNSLDWWSHGPRASYKWAFSRRANVELGYSFGEQRYREEPSSLSDSTELSSNPTERHLFHSADLEFKWEPRDSLEFSANVGWERKDDQYQDFESHNTIVSELTARVPWMGTEFSVEADYRRRFYDKRPDDNSGSLKYHKLSGKIGARRQLSETFALFATYDVLFRSTNRHQGINFRSYLIHQGSIGMSCAL